MPSDPTASADAPLVYVSDAPTNSSLIKMVTVDGFLPEKEGSEEKERLLEVFRAHKDGQRVDPDNLPRTFYADYPDKTQGRLPHLFKANGFWCVSARCAEVLSRFDLGAGGTQPIRAFQHDRTTPIDGQYAVLNFGARKNALVAEECARIERPYPKHELWELPIVPKDNEIAVSPTALGGQDLWVDPRLRNGFFVSAPLADALRKTGVGHPMGPEGVPRRRRC